MSAILGRISFRIRPLWTGVISTLLRFTGSRHSLTLPFTLGSAQSCCTTQMFFPHLVGLLFAAFVSPYFLPGDSAKHMLLF